MSELWRKSAVELAALVRSREVSATDVVTDALQRLQTVNPAINAVVAQMPDEALQRARDIDAAIARGEDPGALAGVPVTIKVNTDQVGHASTNGLKLQRDLIASEDSPIVSNFHKAGAVIIGRTNTPAFSLRWFTRNQLHGHTRNPRDRSRTPGGSRVARRQP
jgi:amidase